MTAHRDPAADAALDELASQLAEFGPAPGDRFGLIRRALHDAQHEGAARALDQLADELAAGSRAPATPELLHALAGGYRLHIGRPT